MTFSDQEECSRELERLLTGGADDPELARLLSRQKELTDALLVAVPKRSPGGGSAYDLVSPYTGTDLRWVVRNADVDVLKGLVQGVTSAAAGVLGYCLGGAPVQLAAVIATSLANAFLFFRDIYQKGANLSPDQFNVLRGLKSSKDGMTVEDIKKWMVAIGKKTSTTKIGNLLKQLSNVRLSDGTIVPLVNKDAGNRWSAAGV